MQEVRAKVDWTNKESWSYPSSDDGALMVCFQWRADLEGVVKLCRERKLAIQAGAAFGLWPHRLASLFNRVITFEPLHENYQCADANLRDLENVIIFKAALSDTCRRASMSEPFNKGNMGTCSIKPGTSVEVITIDSLRLEECSLMYLDIEGEELPALKGAEETIKQFRPVIALEYSPHKIVVPDPNPYLKTLGYQQIAKFHNDYVYIT
jgi:FkbM family methyltransferase